MKIHIISECGYETAALGFSLSYNSTRWRAKELFPVFAHKQGGENKFLESIVVWLDITAPRFWWAEFDTYRVGVSKQSQSTMHTITKRELTEDDFEYPIEYDVLDEINNYIRWYQNPPKGEEKDYKTQYFLAIKNILPEGFLQRRIVCTNYKTLQNMYHQRKNHRLPQWDMFCGELLKQLEHPNFISPDYKMIGT